jgi:hypothetical protein
MGTRHDIELTPEQKGILTSLSEETGESISALIDQVLDELQERLRTAHGKKQPNGSEGQNGQPAEARSSTEEDKPIWEVFADSDDIPEEEWEKLPTDLATQHDHYIYGTPKRPV